MVQHEVSYLHEKGHIPSYFITTSVLWLCELSKLNDSTSTDYDQLTIKLANMWLDLACQLLNTGVSEHYFIQNLNILEPYSESLNEAKHILKKDARYEINHSLIQTVTRKSTHKRTLLIRVANKISSTLLFIGAQWLEVLPREN
ncbi:unnamed protein product [Didymodactylos carnosus]|uniref:Mab-21-like HhH/H2TH-like domain-containing protein n=1 Tax=Didymodactylos carnosus TaxID=1234261 RepID=A0A8S2E6K6_9BILA|nr:unnamed protein product [Didymodactylos carnosus]CAF3947795.1 unnamed protein product [Didymodactylos carnosus]